MSGQENDTVQEDESNEVADPDKVATENINDELEVEPELEKAGDQETDIEALQNQLEKEKEQSQVNLDTALRAQAEMENLRKRTTRDIENAHKYALDKFVNELLPIIDSLESGISHAEDAENIDELRKGIDLTLQMFITVMEKFGVKALEPQDEKFNPEQHEAVSMQEIAGSESGTVVTVMQKGYELNGRLVRPAMVVVAK
ncbi:MAG: nucleotide exchange factor GrpE [Proteobacteria bacterium]|nr:nucleotide exchange factor GrpE [Pseudomonadota bacterium]